MSQDEAPETQDAPPELQCLTFALDTEVYAIDVLEVKEIRSWSKPTPMPESPESVLGVMNLRGAIIPVIDLRQLLGIETTKPTAMTSVVVVQRQGDTGGRSLGMVVDQVLDVCHLALKSGETTPESGDNAVSRFIRSLSLVDDQLVIVLDLKTLVAASLSEAGETLDETALPSPDSEASHHAA